MKKKILNYGAVVELIKSYECGTLTSKELDMALELYPEAVLRALYNREEYKGLCLSVLKNNLSFLDDNRFSYELLSVDIYRNYILDNFNTIVESINDVEGLVLNLFQIGIDSDKSILNMLAYNDNMKVRSYFMMRLAECGGDFVRKYYPNITEYFVKKDSEGNVIERMKESTLSEICINLLDFYFDKDLFDLVKEYIYSNYPSNSLLRKLDKFECGEIFHATEIIANDFDRLFKTSSDYKLIAFQKYGYLLSQNEREKISKCFKKLLETKYYAIQELFERNLSEEFIHLASKYLGISTNQEFKYLGNGSTTYTFQVGDFVLKFIMEVYTFNDLDNRCPRSFLINRVYDEVVKYDEEGHLLGILQVQPRLDVPLRKDETELMELFHEELAKQGYYCDDDLVTDLKQNVYRLHSYRDADTTDPESLPDWFKKDPIVLVDEDMVYKLEDKDRIMELKNKPSRFYF